MRFRLKNKDTEAALRGYIIFRVNGRIFWSYEKANSASRLIEGSVLFAGLHVTKGWLGFFQRIENPVEFRFPDGSTSLDTAYRYPTDEYLEGRRRQIDDELRRALRYYNADVLP